MSCGKVEATCETSYPFADSLEYTFVCSAPFEFMFRSPGSEYGHFVAQEIRYPLQSGINAVSIPAGKSKVTVVSNVSIRIETRPSGAVSILRGPLLFALEIQSKDDTVKSLPFDDAKGSGRDFADKRLIDHRLTNTSAWNVAIDPSTLEYHPQERFTQSGSAFLSKDTAYMTVKGCEVEWPLHLGVTPDWPPRAPKRISEVKQYRLIPYGRAKLHMSELPVINLNDD